MSTASTSAPLPADASPEALVRTLLDISPRGIALLRPRYAEAEAATIVDFTFEQLNQTAQRMLGGLPECPAESFLTLFPSAQYMEGFTFYCRAFHSGQVERYQQLYQADGFDGYYQVVAQRQGPLLVVNFTDSNDQDRSAVEQALRESQAREQVNYRLLHEAQGELYRTLRQLPAAVAVYTGPTHVLTFYNDLHEQLAGRPLTLGLPATELFPDLVGQDFFRVPDQVYATGAAAVLLEVPTPLRNPQTGEVTQHYFTVRYDPRRDAHGYVTGLLVMATSVTDQVLLRQQGQRLNEELAAANEELRANNEEYQQTNLALNETQQQLRQLNQALEVARTSAEHNRAQLHALLTQAPVAIGLFTGSELRVSSINPLMADLLGYTPTQLLGQPLFEQAPELQNQGFDELMRQVQATRVPFVGREVAATVKRNGQLLGVYFNFVYQPLYDAEEQVIGIINVAVDVTEQVVARQQVEQLNAELETRVQERTQAALVAQAAAERARARLQALIMQAPVAICVFAGPTHLLEVVNPQMLHMWERTQTEIAGQPFFEVMPELRTQGLPELLAEVYHSGQPFVAQAMAVRLARHAPDETGYYDFVYAPLRDEQGQVEAVLCVASDVSAQVQARQQVEYLNAELSATNEELHERNDQLRRTNVDLDTFIYTASHDLKAPITNIEGLLNALRDQLPAQVQHEELTTQLLAMMQGAVERFQFTINQLTDVSRLQQAHNQPAEQVPLAQVVEDVRLDLLPLLTSTRAQLTVEVDPELSVLFSPKNLRSVVVNLLSNAFKYHIPNQPPAVLLRAVELDGQVVLTVMDNGLGMSEVQQTRLFGLFQRLHTHVEGSGVGLYIIKRMIDNAGGTITVQSQQGQGTMFRVTFPANKAR